MTLPLHGFPDWQGSLQTADLVSINQFQVVNAGAAFSSSVFDTRIYSSYSIKVDTTANVIATAFNPWNISVTWTADPAGTQVVYREKYQIFGDGLGSVAFPWNYGRLELQDAVHGAYLFVTCTNAGTDQGLVTISVYGNSRSLGRRYVTNSATTVPSSVDLDTGLLMSTTVNNGAGVQTNAIMPLSPGPALVHRLAGASPYSLTFVTGTGAFIVQFQCPAGSENYNEIYLPRSAVRVNFNNVGGVIGALVLHVTSGRDNW